MKKSYKTKRNASFDANMRLALFILFCGIFVSTKAQTQYDSVRIKINSIKELDKKIDALHEELRAFENANPDTIISFANWGLELSKKAKDIKSESRFKSVRGMGYMRSSMYSEALKDLFDASRISETLNDSVMMSYTYNNLGNVYRASGKLDEATNYYSKALDIRKAINDSAGISFAYNNLGIVYMMQARYDEGMALWGESLKMKLAVGDSSGAAVTMGNMAMYYRDIGETEKALDFLRQAEAIELVRGDHHGLSMNYSNVGELYQKQEDFEKAIAFYELSKKHADSANNKAMVAEVYSKLTETYEEIGDFGTALEYHRRFKEIEDDILGERTQKDLLVLESQYIAEQQAAKLDVLKAEDKVKEEVIARQNEEKENERLYKIAFGVGFGLMLLLSLVMIQGYRRKQKDNKVISEQKEQVLQQHIALEEKNKEIVDSINYAKRIQTAILPSNRMIEQELDNSFIYYLPKDIVAGDFYWMQKVNDLLFFAVADCTGHGVPGAMVSVVCSTALNRAVNEFALTDPGQILDRVTQLVTETFYLDDEEVNDGMDIALCAWNKTTGKVEYAGANNSLYLVSSNKREEELVKETEQDGVYLYEYKANKQPVGAYERKVPFTTLTIDTAQGDYIYLFSDGYPDQFGGPKGKKFKYSNFKKLLLMQFGKELSVQKENLSQTLQEWKGDIEQIDDICVIGVKM